MKQKVQVWILAKDEVLLLRLIQERGAFWQPVTAQVDENESLIECAQREVFEETGISIYYPDLKFINYNDDVNEGKQNVTFRFGIVLEDYIPKILEVSERGGEDNEVSEIKWIPVKEISKYKWAFNHEQIIWNILHSQLPLLIN